MDGTHQRSNCPRCGTELPAGTPLGCCPVCALGQLLTEGPDERSMEALSLRDIPTPGTTFAYIGDYELIEVIAHGGMGVVYRARQRSLNRIVALKLLLGGAHASEGFKRRFRQEAETVARLQHPNIVPIYEVGEHEGQPYFAMECVDGPNLSKLIREQPLPPKQAAQYVRTVAEAIAYAHAQGVLHRDLKPSNILIGADDRLHITDFGLAVQMDAGSSLTLSGEMLGTPGYMPPEQAAMKRGSVGPHSDIYSLGAVLYHLLTGRAPFVAGTLGDMLRQVAESEPVAPRRLNPSVSIDLETICLKCLEKDPARRYATATDLVSELGRFLEGRPILARPVSPVAALWRWCRRRPVLAALCAVAITSVGVGGSGTIWAWRQAQIANVTLRKALLNQKAFAAEIQFERNEPRRGLSGLAHVLRDDPNQPVAGPRLLAALNWRNWPLPLAELGPTKSIIGFSRFSPRQRYVAACCVDGSIRLWDGQYRSISNSWPRGSTNVVYLALEFSADEESLLAITSDGRAVIGDVRGPVRFTTGAPTDPISAATFLSGGGGVAVVDSANQVSAWSYPEGKPRYSIEAGSQSVAATFSPDGRWIATVTGDNSLLILDSLTGEPAAPELQQEQTVASLAFSPRDAELLVTTTNGDAVLWNWRRAEKGATLHLGTNVEALQFSSEGSRLAVFANNLAVWSTENGKLIFKWEHRYTPVGWAGIFPEDRLVVIEDNRNVVSLDPASGAELSERLQTPVAFEGCDLSPDGQRLLTSTWADVGTIWDLDDGRAQSRELRHAGQVGSIAFSPDKTTVVTGGSDNVARRWELGTWKESFPPLGHTGPVVSLEFSHDSRRIATASHDLTAMIWEATTGKALVSPLMHEAPVYRAKFDPTDEVLATATHAGNLRFWNARSGEALTPSLDVNDPDQPGWGNPGIANIAFSPDGRRLAVACFSGSAQIWNVADGQRQLLLRMENAAPVVDAQFSSDGQRLAAVCMDGTVQVWDSQSGIGVLTGMRHGGNGVSLGFSPDGQKLVTGAMTGPVRVWSAITGKLLVETEGFDTTIGATSFSHSGRAFGAVGLSTVARVWDTATGMPLSEPFLAVANAPNRLRFSLDDHWLATAGSDDRVVLVPQYLKLPPMPGWMPDLADAVAGERINADGSIETVPPSELVSLRSKLEQSSATDFYTRWAHWFFADRQTRLPYPEF